MRLRTEAKVAANASASSPTTNTSPTPSVGGAGSCGSPGLASTAANSVALTGFISLPSDLGGNDQDQPDDIVLGAGPRRTPPNGSIRTFHPVSVTPRDSPAARRRWPGRARGQRLRAARLAGRVVHHDLPGSAVQHRSQATASGHAHGAVRAGHPGRLRWAHLRTGARADAQLR